VQSWNNDEFITPEGRVEQDNAETTQNTTIQQERVRANSLTVIIYLTNNVGFYSAQYRLTIESNQSSK